MFDVDLFGGKKVPHTISQRKGSMHYLKILLFAGATLNVSTFPYLNGKRVLPVFVKVKEDFKQHLLDSDYVRAEFIVQEFAAVSHQAPSPLNRRPPPSTLQEIGPEYCETCDLGLNLLNCQFSF